MARRFISDEPSPFYPPRARWYAAIFYLGNAFRRRSALDRLGLPPEVRLGRLVAGFLVPGLAVYLRGPRLRGQAAMSACAALLLIYVLWLGYPVANMAYGLLLSLHVSGFTYYCQPLLGKEPLRLRLTVTVLVLLAMLLVLYWPARELIQQHLVSPLRVNGRVIIVQRFWPAPVLQRGDWIAYSLLADEQGEVHNGGAVWVHGGAGFGPVLAVGGDDVVFSANGFLVHGVLHTNLPYMPVSGEWLVPEKHWFIWPNLAISGHGNIGADRITAAMMQLANVSPEQYLGRPLSRWVWRQQVLP